MTAAEIEAAKAHYLRVKIEEEIRNLWEMRSLYRITSWTDWAAENRAEIRALARILRRLRKAEPASECQADYLGADGCTCVPVEIG